MSSLRLAFTVAITLAAACALTGCSLLSGQRRFVEQMAGAVLENDDPETVRAGAPAFLLMMDGQVRGDPDNADVLLAAASLYAAYASAFVADETRVARLSGKAFDYANRALAVRHPEVHSLRDCTQDEFRASLARLGADDDRLVLTLGQVWMAWIRARRDDIDALADLPRVEDVMRRAIELGADEGGGAHLNLAILRAMDAMTGGGDLADVRADFEAALEISGRQNLMALVAYAQMYAEPIGDESLRRALLDEVLAADPAAPGRTLMNVMAKEQARAIVAGEPLPGSF